MPYDYAREIADIRSNPDVDPQERDYDLERGYGPVDCEKCVDGYCESCKHNTDGY